MQINDWDYESIKPYILGEFDGVTATNMDTLHPGGSGVDTTALYRWLDFFQRQRAVSPEGGGGIADLADAVNSGAVV